MHRARALHLQTLPGHFARKARTDANLDTLSLLETT